MESGMKFLLLLCGLFVSIFTFAEDDNEEIFYCGFENKAEVKKLSGSFSSKAKFVKGRKGKALELPSGMSCSFPAKNCVSGTEGTLSAWIFPGWPLRDLNSRRVRLFAIMNKEQETKPIHRYNYFCILGHSYGNIEKEIPYQLYCLLRETKQEQGLLKIPTASWKANAWQHIVISWRIGTGKKDGEFIFYLNGKLVARRSDFRAYKIDLGKALICSPNGLLDELKIWNRILTEDEVKSEYSK
jgi:Concanavalin A-like lectin/glucanases superfamily